jgi:hypothetical protein
LVRIGECRQITTNSLGGTKAIVGKLIQHRHFAIWKKRTAEKHKYCFPKWGKLQFLGKSLSFDWQIIGF